MSKDLYKIKDYSDAELYEILDLNNPTDRELEAKILMMIHKYENSKAKSSKKLVKFFEDIYEHFFDDSDEELPPDAEGASAWLGHHGPGRQLASECQGIAMARGRA